jgi:hypothetical protein
MLAGHPKMRQPLVAEKTCRRSKQLKWQGAHMTDGDGDGAGKSLEENPLIAQLIAQGAETAMTLRGFVGRSARDGYIRLFPRIGNLADSVEIARSDIIHSVKAPRSTLGAVIVWVKRDAKISVHKAPETSVQTPKDLVELRKGRLRMRMRAPQARDPLCFSTCMDCLSWCDCSICSTQPQ